MKFTFEPARWFGKAPSPPLRRMTLGQPQNEGDNPLMIQFFTWDALQESTSWWAHFENEIPHLAEMGFTQVWLPPPSKAAVPDGRGYDVYDHWDLGEFNQKGAVGTRWGTKDQLIRACKSAREHKLDIIVDTVLNHKLGADRTEKFPVVSVDPQNRLKDLERIDDFEGWSTFDFPGRAGKYSKLRWDQRHFTGLDWNHKARTKGVYRIAGKGHKGWSPNVSKELGNYDYLLGLDIDHRHPDVRKDLLNWGSWILQETGAVGFRLDAIKHIDRNFLLEFIQTTRRNSSPKMFTVAEYWVGELENIQPWIQTFKGETSFFDVPLHYNFHRASKEGSDYDLRRILDKTVVQYSPDSAVTFVDNHDTVESQSLASWVGDEFKLQAYALILLRSNGYPCVFYGDLYPNREYSETTGMGLKVIIQARKNHAYGPMQDYFENKNCIGFVRMGNSRHEGCAVVLSNSENQTEPHTIRMNVGQSQAGKTYSVFPSRRECIVIDAKGWGSFTCPPNFVWIWTPSTD